MTRQSENIEVHCVVAEHKHGATFNVRPLLKAFKFTVYKQGERPGRWEGFGSYLVLNGFLIAGGRYCRCCC